MDLWITIHPLFHQFCALPTHNAFLGYVNGEVNFDDVIAGVSILIIFFFFVFNLKMLNHPGIVHQTQIVAFTLSFSVLNRWIDLKLNQRHLCIEVG